MQSYRPLAESIRHLAHDAKQHGANLLLLLMPKVLEIHCLLLFLKDVKGLFVVSHREFKP